MNKLFLFLVLSPFLFISCSSDDDYPVTEGYDIKVNVGDTFAMPNGTYTIEDKGNEFIAEILTDGKIIGKHDGVSYIKLKKGNTTYNCKIIVDANTTLYADMKVFLGVSKPEILKLYGQPTGINKQTYYFSNLSIEYRNAFSFNNQDKVNIAAIYFTNSYSTLIGKHLSDRYQMVYTEGDQILYIDGPDMSNFTVGVIVEVTVRDIGIYYMNKADVSTKSTNRAYQEIPLIFNK